MPRENSFSDEDGRSLTPDLELPEGSAPPLSPVEAPRAPLVVKVEPGWDSKISPPTVLSPESPNVPRRPSFAGVPSAPLDRFRASVRKVIRLHRTSTVIADRGGIGAEPGIDPRRDSAYLTYGHIRQNW